MAQARSEPLEAEPLPPTQAARDGTTAWSARPAAPETPARKKLLELPSRVGPAWQVWTLQWWQKRRHLMAAGLGLLAFGWGCTLTWWPGPPLLMGAGAFLIGLALPSREL